MARTKTLSDADVLAALRKLLAQGPAIPVSFRSLSRSVGLAPSTLVQRFGSFDAMRAAAIADGWSALSRASEAAIAAVPDKGPSGVLKALEGLAQEVVLLLTGTQDEQSRKLAQDWRHQVETALAQRIAFPAKQRETAAMLFAAWQGQLLWQDDSFRLKDLLKRLD